MKNRIDDCRILDFPTVWEESGGLTFLEGARHVPFEIRRVYFIHDVPTGDCRGTHAHVSLQQVLIAARGSFNVLLDDGANRRTVTLSSPGRGLYICPMVWSQAVDFSEGAVCLAIASEPYEEADYIRDYGEYLARLRRDA